MKEFFQLISLPIIILIIINTICLLLERLYLKNWTTNFAQTFSVPCPRPYEGLWTFFMQYYPQTKNLCSKMKFPFEYVQICVPYMDKQVVEWGGGQFSTRKIFKKFLGGWKIFPFHFLVNFDVFLVDFDAKTQMRGENLPKI